MVKIRKEINICRGIEGNIRPYAIKKIVKFASGKIRFDAYFLSAIDEQRYENVQFDSYFLNNRDLKFISRR